jgi:hypothetical protein
MLETTYIKIWKEGGILYSVFAEGLHIDIEIARKCVEARITFSRGISYPVFIDMKGIRSVTKEARDYLADEGSRLIKGGALLVDSALTKMLGNIFLQINKPQVPLKLFTDKDEAREWLQQYL